MGLFKKSKTEELLDSVMPKKQKKCKKYGGLITGIVVGGAVGSVASLLKSCTKKAAVRRKSF